ncbi:glutathione S-transferase family protein [Cupriavidus sp. D39]|uniref:glutathione S-transferase family protein n=1 Tax=Cupriavidus sp. D39 TaxID=2997877 RepID=UPI0022701149|nr:glutathione S-transferase family protein [Cupriavidus sp. D39]MCY0853615.1 glutathione S-transferase family protein [Cupriavidus sp. D39]
MTQIVLHFAPHTCARVPMIALEEIGHPYGTELVSFVRGDHLTARYRSLNPKGKVPLLVIDGVPLSENIAILTWLAQRFPEARLLPQVADSYASAQIVSDLAYCSATLHPLVTRLRVPQYFCDIPEAMPRVFAMAEDTMRSNFALIDDRLSENQWWYGDKWSIVDAYLNWVWFRVAGTDFDTSPYLHFDRHDNELAKRPSVQRTLERHQQAADWLASQGLEVKFTGPGAFQIKHPG